jgi:hypothetical protein
MSWFSVVEMEMRSASRKQAAIGLRLLFAMAGSLCCLVILVLPFTSPTQRGIAMLTTLSFVSLGFCLVVGGFLTADCISSEKRGGTLGLLFLTPLKAIDVVLGKLACHGLQLFYGVCALFPVFFLPLLAGGVTGAEVSRIVLALSLVLVLAGCVGILVSTLGTESRQTLMATFTVLVLLTAVPMAWLLMRVTFLKLGEARFGLPALSPLYLVLCGFESRYKTVDGPVKFWGSVAALSLLCVVATALASIFLSRTFRSKDQKTCSSESQREARVQNPLRDLNPYRWSTLRGSGGPLSFGLLIYALLVFFMAMLAASIVTTHWREGFTSAFFTALAAHIVTKLRLVIEATRQISSDRQSGVLELIFVTALSEEDIQVGHQGALTTLSRGPVCLLIGLNLVLELTVVFAPHQLHINTEDFLLFTILFLGGMGLAGADAVVLRWLALRQGLKPTTHMRAALSSFCLLMVPPWIVVGLILAFANGSRVGTHGISAIFCAWIAGCLFYDWVLVQQAKAALQAGMRRMVSEGI